MPAYLPIVSKFDTKGIKQAESSVKKFGKVAAGVGAAAAGAVAGIAAAGIKEFAKFDSALNKSISIMGDVSDALQNDMADTAKEVAKSTTFSAEEAAEAYFFLASAGLDAEQQIAAMPQVAKFAQAGMFDMALATDLATDAQSALGLASDDATENLDNLTRVTDVFVKANTLANTSVEQLATAFTTKAGNALKVVGKDVEEGAAALSVFADQGIKGERAGTLLTNTIFGFTDIMQKAPAEAKALGIEIFNAAGEMNSFADISEDLTTALGTMTKEQQVATLDQLGFTKQAREGALAMIGNADAMREYETALRDAGGTTDEVAGKQLQTLEGQFELLKSAVSVVGIEIGAALEPVLITLMEILTPLVDRVGPKFVAFFENISDRLSGFLTGSQNAADRLATIRDMFVSIRETSPEQAVKFLGEQFSQLGTFITGNLGEAFVGFMQFRQQLVESILEALPGIIDGILTFLPELIRFITEDVLPMIIHQAVGIIESLMQIIVEVFPKIVQTIGELIPSIVEAVANLVPLIIEKFMELLPQLLDGALELFTSLLDAVIQVIPQIVETVVDLIPQVLDAVLSAYPQMLEAALEFFMSLVDAVVDIIPTLLETIVDMIPKITDQLIEMLPKIIDAGLELFLGIVEGLTDAIPDILDAIVDMIPELVDQIIKLVPKLIEAGFELFVGIVSGLLDATPKIIDAVIGMIPKITGALIDNIPKLIDAGFELVKGVATGIITNAPRIIGDAMSSLGNGLINSFKDVLGIQSPSKVFMDLGEEVVNGLDQGIQDQAGAVETTSRELAKTVSDIFDKTLADVAGTTQEIIKQGQSVRATFDDQGNLLTSYTEGPDVGNTLASTGQVVNVDRLNDALLRESYSSAIQDFAGGTQQVLDAVLGQVTLRNPETGMSKTIGGSSIERSVEQAIANGYVMSPQFQGDVRDLIDVIDRAAQTEGEGILPKVALASGGIVTSPISALIGEDGPEAVIPLDRLDNMQGNTYNISINAGVGSDPVSIGRYVVDAIKRYEGVSGKVFVSA